MSIVGDYKLPLPEVIYLIEKIIKYEIDITIDLVEIIASKRDSKLIEFEDFIYFFRNDLV